MAQSSNADRASVGFSTAPSTAYSDLDSPTNSNPSEPNGEVTTDTSPSIDYIGYEGIDWSRLPGYYMRKHGRRVRTGWVWEYGYDIEKAGSGRRSWLCKECHRRKATTTHMYLSTQPASLPSAACDEYAAWIATTDPGDCLVDNPIQYWLLRRRQYPRLSRMAIDLFSIPAMSSEPERIFSLAGLMVTAQRGQLRADIIGAAQCISSWEKSGAIQISK